MLRPKAEDFENSASASATEGFEPKDRRLSRRFDVQQSCIKIFYNKKSFFCKKNNIFLSFLNFGFSLKFSTRWGCTFSFGLQLWYFKKEAVLMISSVIYFIESNVSDNKKKPKLIEYAFTKCFYQ